MTTPPDTNDPAHRWRLAPLLAGAVAFLVYLLTISRGAYPGASATLIASAARLIPDHLPDHPVWSLLTRGIASTPVLSLPLRLNLFSALCGAAAVALFGWLVSAFIFETVSEDAGSQRTILDENEDDRTDDDDARRHSATAAAPVLAGHNRRAWVAAQLGGWSAAIALACCTPFWSAATRLHYQTFDVLLLLAILHLVRLCQAAERPALALTAAFLCGAGCIESAIFVPLSAALFVLLPVHLIRRESPWERTLLFTLLAAAVGAAIGLLALQYARSSAPLAAPVSLRSAGVELLRAHYETLRHSLPRTNWIWVVLLAFAPFAVVLPTARISFLNRSSLHGMLLHLVFMTATLICLFNAPFSPWGLARITGHLPIMACLAVAAVAGYLVAYWRLLGMPAEFEEHASEADDEQDRADAPPENHKDLALPLGFRRWLGAGIGWPLLVLVCVVPLINLHEADGRQGAFADAAAHDALALFGGRDWIASGGLLDCHLLLAARMQDHDLRLLPLAAGADPRQARQLQEWIRAEPAFGDHRARLCQAAGLGVQPFLAEWLRTNSSAKHMLLVTGTSVIWKKAGWQPVPTGIGYAGTPQAENLRTADLLGTNRLFWAHMATVLAPTTGAPPALDELRLALRRQLSRTANDLGVLLQDLARDEEAYEAYRAARLLDARNLSSAINLYFLSEKGIHAGEKTTLGDAIRAGLDEHPVSLPELVEACGDVRHADALAVEGRFWSLRGQPAIAKTELDRAIVLTPDHAVAQQQLAALYLTQGNVLASERTYRALLTANPADHRALLGLATVALQGGRIDDARQWLEKARAAGAAEDALALCDASLLLASNRSDEALAQLHALTDKHPDNLEAWSLLGDALLRREAFAEIEQRVLPAMRQAAGKGDHALIHVLRARLLARKPPVDFVAARNAYLQALALRPDLAGVRNDLLALDQQSGDRTQMEGDATAVLRADPDNAFANYLLARALLERNDLDRAEACLQRSLTSSKTPGTLNALAETLRRQKRFDVAEKRVREALAQAPDFYPAWDTLGCILLDAGRSEEAAQAIQQALALCKTEPRLYVSLARVRIAQARPDDARLALHEISVRCKSIPAEVTQDIATLERQLARSGQPAP